MGHPASSAIARSPGTHDLLFRESPVWLELQWSGNVLAWHESPGLAQVGLELACPQPAVFTHQRPRDAGLLPSHMGHWMMLRSRTRTLIHQMSVSLGAGRSGARAPIWLVGVSEACPENTARCQPCWTAPAGIAQNSCSEPGTCLNYHESGEEVHVWQVPTWPCLSP